MGKKYSHVSNGDSITVTIKNLDKVTFIYIIIWTLSTVIRVIKIDKTYRY